MNKHIINCFKILFLLLLLFSCIHSSEKTSQTGYNKELRKVLAHYKKNKRDSLKLKAACFLIDNMKWHASDLKLLSLEPRFHKAYQKTDSVFRHIAKGMNLEELTSQPVRKTFTDKEKITRSYFDSTFSETIIKAGYFPDQENISSDFLIAHIENAFRQKNSHPYASRLSFEDFCQYILPYRSCEYSFFNEGGVLNTMFSSYLNQTSLSDLKQKVSFYNAYIFRMKCLYGPCPIKGYTGIYDLFYTDKHDCVGIASHAANIFRACGYPIAVDFYTAHKTASGRHYFCSIRDSSGIWKAFSPETNTLEEFNFNNIANAFRCMLSAQKNTPYALKNENEYIPKIFNTPCLTEVTALNREVKEINLPIADTVKNRLAYLLVFQNNTKGITPATWGVIKNGQACFKNVLPGILYFPVYFEGKQEIYFAPPFWITRNPDKQGEYITHTLNELFDSPAKSETTILTRKFPRKESMKKLAERMVGGKFIASNDKDFTNSKLLHTIRNTPQPYMQEFKIHSPEPFRYYRYVAPKGESSTYISHIEFITDSDFKYPNTAKALHVSDFKHFTIFDTTRIKLINTLDSISDQIPWLDGNMQTSLRNQPYITFELLEPQMVTSISFAPVNADNGIKKNHKYILMYWQNGWKRFSSYLADQEFLKIENLPSNKLYWLKNITEGNEELPFIVRNGKQLFIYHDILL